MRSDPPAEAPDSKPDRPAVGSITRGFLFADLRGYTSFVETHGAASAVELLTRFRFIVREQIDHFHGAEIRTEGDSFYVVFGSVSDAVRAGLGIAEAARLASPDQPAEPIRVGIGIHAGETVETPEGYVGSAVNIAARICAIAQSGEVLVSDTVRALTQTLLPVRFVPRGRRQLKGLADQVALYAVEPTAATAAWGGGPVRSTRRRLLIGAGAAAVIALAALGWWVSRPTAELPPGPWTIGLDMPLTGDAAFRGGPMRDAVQLAIDEVNAGGGIGGVKLLLDARDDAAATPPADAGSRRGATNVVAFAADPKVVAMIGPSGSSVAAKQIPITNRAGLLQCSPANTRSGLTKPRSGALDLRSAYPTRINYVRLAPVDDIQGPASASFAFNDLGAHAALVVDDAGDGREIADAFEAAFKKLGGTTVRRALNPGSDPKPVLQPLASTSETPTLVFFGGFTDTGALELRRAMVDLDDADDPLAQLGRDLGWLRGGQGLICIQQLGAAATGSYLSHATIGPLRADFEQRFRNKYKVAPDEYAGAAYACAEVIVAALREVAKTGPAPRSYARRSAPTP